MRTQTDLRTMKKGVNKIKNQEEMGYKIIQNCKITDFGDKLGQRLVQLSLELNVIETSQFFCRKSGSMRFICA